MGHISLVVPVAHIWYFRSLPNKIGYLLGLPTKKLDSIIYYERYVIIQPGIVEGREKLDLLEETEYTEILDNLPKDNQMLDDSDPNKFIAKMGAEAIYTLLEQLDLDTLSYELRHKASNDSSQQRKTEALKRLQVVESFRQSKGKNRPEWMIVKVVPVIPPELRPLVPLDGGRFATSDLNDLYRRVIIRNNRLKRLMEIKAPEVILRNEKRMLQEAVDAPIDNGRRGRAVTGANSRALKSLSDMLKGKQGRFRQNLLGKRVDYSGRSVIVVGPDLKIYQCGVPKEMAIELFRPFIMKKLVADGSANNIKSAKKKVDRGDKEVWDCLEFIIKEHPVLLNRAPTLHRLGIQAFEPILVEGRALKLHPLVCTAYNADFDGDQMAIHVPLSVEAQAEARILMLSANNLLHPKDGNPVTVPTQDMVLGAYYLTYVNPDEAPLDENGKKLVRAFSTTDEALMAYASGDIKIHAPIKVRVTKTFGEKTESRVVESTIGRIIFNEAIPQDLGFVDRENDATRFDFENGFYDKVDENGVKVFKQCTNKDLREIIRRTIAKHGFARTAELVDDIKALGFKYSTKGALTISISDMVVPELKKTLISETEAKVVQIESYFNEGMITNDERYRSVVDAWEATTAAVSNALQAGLDKYNPIYMMADSGARGSMTQIRQLAGMRGLIANTAGKTIEIPIKANFREGLTVLEYFISSRGARKGLADTALRTADSGYLTRRLVDVSQDVIIREHDCGTQEGIIAAAVYDKGVLVQSFGESIHGRFPLRDITDPQTGELLIDSDTMLMSDDAEFLEGHGISSVEIRSVLACEAKSGVCAKCYGINLALGAPVNSGEAVGVIAAQSIGEPGTQLTMRTFHTGGIAGDDITQGLPRVEELFEARKPKKMAILAETSGKVSLDEGKKSAMCAITITNEDEGETCVYQTPYSSGILVADGDRVDKGQELTAGALSPHDVLRIRGISDCQNYLIAEVQKVYRQQGVDINDKHIEVIVRQMMRKIRVDDPGDTDLLTGATTDVLDYKRANRAIAERNTNGELNEMGEPLRPAIGSPILMGITKASLATESFLSAASFQETTKVLTEAAIKGKIDHLVGLKENVIIGKLIPAGSGLDIYRDFEYETDEEIDAAEDYVDLSALVGRTNAI